jgi:hypothetical protein
MRLLSLGVIAVHRHKSHQLIIVHAFETRGELLHFSSICGNIESFAQRRHEQGIASFEMPEER